MRNRNTVTSSRRELLAAAVAAAGLSVAARISAGATATQRRPNLVLILTDDQRADLLGCAGNPILKTPSIDALATDGVRFTQSFATTAICMSSRASILTGLYSRVHGSNSAATPLSREKFATSYPMLLRKAGYRTGFVGKWGIDGCPLPTGDYDFFTGYTGQGSYFEPGSSKHLTVRQGEEAVRFLQGCTSRQPFCLAVSFKAPHVQDEGRNQPGIYPKYPYDRALDDLYKTDQIPPPATIDTAPMPPFLEHSLNRTREAPDFSPQHYQETMRDLYRLLAGVDQAVGKITAEIKRLGFDDNTVILYSSDHGSFYGEHGFGGKWLMHEESIRTPMILRDPRLSADCRGTQRHEMVLNIDIPATLLDLAGIDKPAGMQGKSFLPLASAEAIPWRTEWFYENHYCNSKADPIAASEGIRTRDWKYIRYVDEDPVYEQLYDLNADPREETNLAVDVRHQHILADLRQRWNRWKTCLDRFALQYTPDQPWHDPV